MVQQKVYTKVILIIKCFKIIIVPVKYKTSFWVMKKFTMIKLHCVCLTCSEPTKLMWIILKNTYSGREMDSCPWLLLFINLALAAALKMLDIEYWLRQILFMFYVTCLNNKLL